MILSMEDRYALARAMQGLEPVPMVGISPPVQLVINNLANVGTGQEVLDAVRRVFGQDAISQVFSVDPHDAPPVPAGSGAAIPPLPKKARLSQAAVDQGAMLGWWLDEWMKFATRRASMTDRMFLQAGGLWLISLVTARRARLSLDFGHVHNNLYVLWIAGTTYWRKSTGLRAVEDVARATVNHLLMASQSTPEMLLYRLSGQMPANYDELDIQQRQIEQDGQKFAAQRGFISDEASKLFGKKYMEGLPELFMEAYDAPRVLEQEFKSQGKLVVHDPALNLLFATTPARLQTVFGDGEWEDGLLPRFALLTPTSDIVTRTHSTKSSDQHQPSTALLKNLRKLYEWLPQPRLDTDMDGWQEGDSMPDRYRLASVDVDITPEALEAWNWYADAMHQFTRPGGALDERLTGVYGRLPVMGLKIAMSLCLSDFVEMSSSSPGQPQISLGHWAKAQQIMEAWRESSHRLLSVLNRAEDQKYEERVLQVLRGSGGKPLSAFQLYRQARIPMRRDAYATVQALHDDGQIVKVDIAGREGYVLNTEKAG